jgi:hypothetical protein
MLVALIFLEILITVSLTFLEKSWKGQDIDWDLLTFVV